MLSACHDACVDRSGIDAGSVRYVHLHCSLADCDSGNSCCSFGVREAEPLNAPLIPAEPKIPSLDYMVMIVGTCKIAVNKRVE